MSRSISIVARRAINAQETGEVFLEILSLEHPEFDSPVCVVNNTEPITSNGITYNPFPFQIDLPREEEGQISKATLKIDAIDRSLIEKIRTIDTPMDATLSVLLASQPDTIEAGPFNFKVKNVTYNATVISGDLIYEDVLKLRYPKNVFDPYDFPGLF